VGRSGSLGLTVAALALAARLVVAAAFVVAAVQKLRALPVLRTQIEGFGVPDPLVGVSVAFLPVAELATAAALVVATGSPVPAFVAIGLLGAFTGVVVANLSRGHRPPCPCFGTAASDAPISARTVARNGWLLALAVIATGSVDGAEAVPVVVLTVVLGAVTAWFVAVFR
jgi:Methylamine utilisation protein MauE